MVKSMKVHGKSIVLHSSKTIVHYDGKSAVFSQSEKT